MTSTADGLDPVVEPLPVRDDRAMREWYAVYLAAETLERPWAAVWELAEVRAAHLDEHGPVRSLPFLARLGSEVVAAAVVELPMHENLTSATLSVGVRPDLWRRGIGSAVLAEMERVAARHGRTQLLGEVGFGYDGHPEGRGTPGVEFALRHGYTLALGDVQRVLDLPVPDAVLDALEDRAARRRHEGYSFRQVVGALPEDLALPVGALRAAVDAEAPSGDILRERGEVDLERVRAAERSGEAMGRTRVTTAALAPDGTVVGYTDYSVSTADSPWVWQWGTLVERAHRGHALGLALKVRNTRLVQERFPGRQAVRTWNAESNAPMVAVNELLGFRPVDRLGEFVKRA